MNAADDHTEPSAADPAEAATRPDDWVPVVGVGASAGGLLAFEAFFAGMPRDADPGMAFVLVQHLAPDHASVLTELVRRYTRMDVRLASDAMPVRANCAYVIPPERDLALCDGALRVLEPSAPRGLRHPIDSFFRSLAEDQGARAICVVLSGTGNDGTLGLRAVKAAGGFAVVQTPGSAEHDGMPRSALATGLVDHELPPAEMARALIAHVASARRTPSHVAKGGSRREATLAQVFALLRARTGQDFSEYKPSTIHRRIERRMAVKQIASLDAYAGYLAEAPEEVDALFRDLLIGVTSFFRDPEAFQSLETHVIPALFEGLPVGSTLRAWTAGCSTGEEAYSLAILLRERIELGGGVQRAQVFATDVDAGAIAIARMASTPPASPRMSPLNGSRGSSRGRATAPRSASTR